MMDFVMLTISFTVAILLASFAACVVVLSKPVMKWYMKKASELTLIIMGDVFQDVGSDLEKEES